MPLSLEIQVDVGRETQLRRAISGLMARTEDLRPALKEIAADFERHMGEVFRSEGARTAAGRWAPLSRRYAARKERAHPGKRILERTGALGRSLTGGPEQLKQIDRMSLVIGTELRTPGGRWNLGGLHQTGTTRGMPARRIIDLPEDVKQRWVRILLDHVWNEP